MTGDTWGWRRSVAAQAYLAWAFELLGTHRPTVFDLPLNARTPAAPCRRGPLSFVAG